MKIHSCWLFIYFFFFDFMDDRCLIRSEWLIQKKNQIANSLGRKVIGLD